MKTTNYYDTFIEIAEDCPVTAAQVPPIKDASPTIANIEYDMISSHPYEYTSDDVLFRVFAVRNDISAERRSAEREQFFAKGQPCLRSSPLTKRYGWGVHNDSQGRIALYAVGSSDYNKLVQDHKVTHLKAMRSKRA